MSEKPAQNPNCFACVHFYITYDQSKPYGCRALGFKSAWHPAVVVRSNSGLPCQLFTPKPR